MCHERENTLSSKKSKYSGLWLVDWYWLVIEPWGKISEKTENSAWNGSSKKYNHSCTCQVKVCFPIFSQITTLKSLGLSLMP